jgi:hypothetical protein
MQFVQKPGLTVPRSPARVQRSFPMPAVSAVPVSKVTAPPVYRPNASPVQSKAIEKRPAPPVYHPSQSSATVQGKMAPSSRPVHKPGTAPPVYRPAVSGVKSPVLAPEASRVQMHPAKISARTAGPGSARTIQRMIGAPVSTGGVGGFVPVVVDEDTLKRRQVAADLRESARRDWRVGDNAELTTEIKTYAKELQEQVAMAIEGKKHELNQRHKTAWDTLAQGLARAVENNDPDVANAVIAVSGSWHQGRLTAESPAWKRISLDSKNAVEFLQDVGRNALNVYSGLASVNKGKSSGFDAHWMDDLLGLKKIHDPSDGTMTPFSSAVSRVPTSGLFSGETKLSTEHLKGLLGGSVEHYKRLLALSEGDDELKRYYGSKIKSLMGSGWAFEAFSEK